MLDSRSIALQGIGFAPRHVALLGFVAFTAIELDVEFITSVFVTLVTPLSGFVDGLTPGSLFAMLATPSSVTASISVGSSLDQWDPPTSVIAEGE